MSDQEVIDAGIARADESDGVIDDLTARVIANAWHGGAASALYALASTGAILPTTAYVIRRELEQSPLPELAALLGYVRRYGERGPVEGWGNLGW